MPTMSDLLAATPVGDERGEWLHRLVAEWQLLADLSFADLLLWVPAGAGQLLAVAQLRPTTGSTAHQDDLVGTRVTAGQRPQLARALSERRICREADPVWVGGLPVREEAIPVCMAGVPVAVVSRETNLATARTPSRLELTYLQTADDLARMICDGSFPFPASVPTDEDGPRVGDGLLRLDQLGAVVFASPNALSAYRRLGLPGDLVGARLSEVTAALAYPGGMPESLARLTAGSAPGTVDVEAPGAVVQLRGIPLSPGGAHVGAAVLVRDLTELRHRDRQLVSKDVTIREIHHRVKNNLQTVAALLRLQARRLAVPEARAALEESVRRVSSIALVHETLSRSAEEQVDFDSVVGELAGMVVETAAPDAGVTCRVDGSFGCLPAALASSLAMVLTELVQNAVQHAFGGAPGRVTVEARRGPGELTVRVVDDGAGLPPGFRPDASPGLGLQIVRTLVEQEVGGRLRVQTAPAGGTEAVLALPVG
jgi:two-component sensor histidine kinase